jgi:hypothetical protein
MVPRATLVAVLIGVEGALLFSMAVAVRGGLPGPSFGFHHAADVPAGAPSWSFSAGPNASVVIDIGLADLTIETQAGARIAVAVVPGLVVGSPGSIAARDDGGTIRVTTPDNSGWVAADDRNVHVIVPPATRIIVEEAGDIVASGLRASASFDSPHGWITVRDFHGDLTATSSNGHIDVSDADCPTLHASSENGRVVLRRVSAQNLIASSSNGRVEATGLEAHNGSVSSSNGRVSLGFAPGADTTVDATASNGSVNVTGFAAVAAGGVNPPSDDSDDEDSSARTVRVGGGSGRLDVRANNGSIDLTREG